MFRKLLFILPLLTSFAVSATSLDSLKSYYSNASSSSEKCDYLLLISSEFSSSNIDSALYYGKLANQLSAGLSLQKQQKCLYNIASLYKEKGNYSLGKEHALLSLNIADSINDSFGSSEANLILAHCSALLGEYNNSILYYENCINLFTNNANAKGLAYSHLGLGNVYFYQEDLVKAKIQFEISVKYLDSIQDLEGKAGTLVSLGNLALSELDYKKAIFYYNLSYQLYDQMNKKSLLSLVAYNLADCYLQTKNYTKSEKYFSLSLDYAKSNGSGEDLQYAYKGLSNHFEAIRDFEKSLEFSERYHEIKDSLNEQRYLIKVGDIEAKYGKKLTKDKLTVAESQLINVDERLKETELYIWLLFIGGGILALASISFYAIWRKSRRTNAVLSVQSKNLKEQSDIIDSSLKEKDLLLKEVHHRVKNNLQMISSLLNLQVGSLESKSAIKALEESKNRVQAIALLHKSLYQDNNLAKVNLKEYIVDLTGYYKQLFTSKNGMVIFQLDVVNKEINLDTAVPFGLIISELISNSNEHAFSAVNNAPKISIEISELGAGEMKLIYSDNGIGLDEDYEVSSDNSLGVEIIKALVEQLDGNLRAESVNGAVFTINIMEQTS